MTQVKFIAKIYHHKSRFCNQNNVVVMTYWPRLVAWCNNPSSKSTVYMPNIAFSINIFCQFTSQFVQRHKVCRSPYWISSLLAIQTLNNHSEERKHTLSSTLCDRIMEKSSSNLCLRRPDKTTSGPGAKWAIFRGYHRQAWGTSCVTTADVHFLYSWGPCGE